MSSPGGSTGTPAGSGPGTVDMKLEVVTLAVSDVDRAKTFYPGPWLAIGRGHCSR